MHGKGPLRLHWSTDLLVRQTRSNQVLRVECAERCSHSGSDPDDAFFHAWPKQGNPKFAAENHLGTAHRGWATGMGRAIMLHLFDRRCCMIDHAAPMGGLTISVHLPLQRASARERMCFFCDGARLCPALTGSYYLSRGAIYSNEIVR